MLLETYRTRNTEKQKEKTVFCMLRTYCNIVILKCSQFSRFPFTHLNESYEDMNF